MILRGKIIMPYKTPLLLKSHRNGPSGYDNKLGFEKKTFENGHEDLIALTMKDFSFFLK